MKVWTVKMYLQKKEIQKKRISCFNCLTLGLGETLALFIYMEELIRKINNTGWFSGELKIDIQIRRTFEGYHGRASEDWETQYEFTSTEIESDKGKVLFPRLHRISKRNQSFEDFIKSITKDL